MFNLSCKFLKTYKLKQSNTTFRLPGWPIYFRVIGAQYLRGNKDDTPHAVNWDDLGDIYDTARIKTTCATTCTYCGPSGNFS